VAAAISPAGDEFLAVSVAGLLMDYQIIGLRR